MIYLTNGNMPLNAAYSDEIVQEDNSTYQLSFRFPTSDSLWEQLKEETFLTADDLHGEQDFVIFEVEKKHGYIQVYANQVFTLLNNYVVNPISLDRQTGSTALSRFAGSITRNNPFSFFSDIEDRHTFNIDSKNAMEAFAKDKHSIIGQWGGDLVRHGYQVRLLKNGGSENESLFMYKKNLSSYQHKTSTKSLKTRITFKTTVKGEGEKVPDRTFTVTIDSPLINKYSQIYEDVIEVNDQDVKDEASLRKYGEQYYRTSLCDMMEDSLEIEVVCQSDVSVQMFDVVSIFHERYNLDVRKKITKYTYSPMAKKLKSIGFGQFQSGLANAIGNAVSDAVKGEAQQLQDDFERQLARELKNADLTFDRQKEELINQFTDGLNATKARAEEVKRELSDTIDQRFDSFDNGPLQEAKRRAEEALRSAGASTLLAQEAKRIGLDSVAKLEEFKKQATSAQTALSGDLDVLKQKVTSEVNQASEYRRTTTEALSRMTGQMDGFATKSEVKQGIDGLTQAFAKIKVGSRNYAEDYDFSRGLWIYSQGDSSPVDWKIINGEYNVKGTTNTWKQMQIHSKEGSRSSWKSSTALLELGIGETYTLSFQGICYSGSPNVWVSLRANRTAPGNPEIMNGNFNLTSSWQTYQVTIPALTKPDNFDFWRIILGYNEIGHVAFRKVELTRSSTRIDAGPAPEDGKTDLVVAKSEFEKTAEGLSAKMTAVERYVNQDGQRQESLQRYAREESAKQATAVREQISRDYVGKSAYQEDVRGLERRFSAISTQTNNDIASKIAQYKQTVDGQFANISSQISGKVNQTDFQRVQETSKLYERIIGRSESDVADKVARMAMTNQLFQVEVAKAAKGGRNYIRNGQFKNGSKNWLEYQSVNFGLYFNYQHSQAPNNRNRPGAHFFHDSQNVADFFGLQQAFAFEGVRGEKVSVSLLVSKDGDDTYSGLRVALHYIKNKNIVGQEWQGIPSAQITSKYKRFTFTFTLSDDVDQMNLMLFGEKGKTINLYVTDVQLERGSIATDYKESPDDTDEAIRSVQTQLAGSWAVQNINSAGDIISGINLGANGHNRLDGKLTHITGETLIERAVIKSAMVDKLKTANFEAGSVTTVVLDAEAVTAEKLKVDQAFFNKFVANEAYLKQLFAKQAFINRVQSVAIDASQVRSGILSGDRIYGGTIRGTNIYGGTLTGHTKIQLGSYGSFDTVNGGLQINVPRDYNAKDGLGVQFIGSYGRGENVPYGLFIYKDSDFTTGGYASKSDDFLLTVEGYIKANGIGWLKTGLGKVGSVSTGTLAFWNSTVALDFAPSDIYYTYGGQAYGLWAIIKQNFSDRRLKENIVDCKHKAIDYIQQFQFKEYDWKKQEDRPRQAHTKIGLIAQEVQAVDSTLVYENGDTLNLDNLRLTNIALKAIQELALENKTLTHRLENLENERRTT
ncbi:MULTISPECIES: phage tail spike protein [Streptococcus]|uniref:phage tail spike protein n=1 Tax=Streptococcus TaxID=1301 RepID=UPI001105DB44|nr:MULTISPECIES: phage tail spike protein [Streptococcus]